MTQNAKANLLLSDLQQDHKGIIKSCVANGVLKQKLLNMGFIPGAEVLMIRNAPLRDPIEIGIQNYFLTIRRSEASLIRVEAL